MRALHLTSVAVLLALAGSAAAQSTLSPAWSPYREAARAAEAAAQSVPLSIDEEVALVRERARADMSVVPSQAICEIPCEEPMSVQAIAATPEGSITYPSGEGYVMATSPYVDSDSPSLWRWRLLPADLVWSSYWASAHEPRLGFQTFYELDGETPLLDATLGGRAALLRYGTDGGNGVRPVGWELQVEGAALPRLNLDEMWDLEAVDFRAGVPLVYGRQRWQAKLAYYHISAHMGDEFAIREGALAQRINYSRDTIVIALAVFPLPAWRWYAEAGYAFYTDGGSEPFEFQFGVDVAEPGPTGAAGTPYFSVNGHLREEHNFGGNLVVQGGWLWRGQQSKVVRLGVHYFNGKSNQYQLFDDFEQQIGGGVWYDF